MKPKKIGRIMNLCIIVPAIIFVPYWSGLIFETVIFNDNKVAPIPITYLEGIIGLMLLFFILWILLVIIISIDNYINE